jgi:hypothetical protein
MKGYGEDFRISGSAWKERRKAGIMREGFWFLAFDLAALKHKLRAKEPGANA